jgi:hypothetical protein
MLRIILALGEVPVLCGVKFVTIDATAYDVLDTEPHHWLL